MNELNQTPFPGSMQFATRRAASQLLAYCITYHFRNCKEIRESHAHLQPGSLVKKENMTCSNSL